MKKKPLSFHYIILTLFCQLATLITTTAVVATNTDTSTATVPALSDTQRANLVTSCSDIITKLKAVQQDDSRVRTYLGERYETILTNYLKPFNTRLVANDFADTDAKTQSDFVSTKTIFATDFVSYQKSLEELIATDCAKTPDDFYQKLNLVRSKRELMNQNVLAMKNLISSHVIFVNNLEKNL